MIKFIHIKSSSLIETHKFSADSENKSYTVGLDGVTVETGDPDYLWTDCLFIKDISKIWTHGKFYSCSFSESGTYPDLTSGSALNLEGKTEISGTFKARPTGGNEDVSYDTASIQRVTGYSLAWNQLAPEITPETITAYNDEYIDLEVSDSIVNVTVKDGETSDNVYGYYYGIRYTDPIPLIPGHKYVCSLETRIDKETKFAVDINEDAVLTTQNSKSRPMTISSGWSNLITNIDTAETDRRETKLVIRPRKPQNSDPYTLYQVRNVKLFDLTLIYGAGKEPKTAEEFEQDYRIWFGQQVVLSEEEQDTGSLRSCKADGIKTSGFNLINVPNYKGTTQGWYQGCMIEWSNSCGYEGQLRISFDLLELGMGSEEGRDHTSAGYNFIYEDGSSSSARPNVACPERTSLSFTSDPGKKVLKITRAYGWGGNIEISNVCLNFVWSGKRDGEYEPYWEETQSLPLTSLTSSGQVIFPDGLKGIGDVKDEVYVENGVTKAIKRIGQLDLGTLNWAYRKFENTDIPLFYSVDTNPTFSKDLGIKKGSRCITPHYVDSEWRDLIDPSSDKRINAYSTNITVDGNVMIHDNAYTDVTSLKQSLQGQILYFELAEPEEYVIDNFSLPVSYRIDDFGTEDLISSDHGSLCGGITVKYGINATDTIRRLPRSYVSTQAAQDFITEINKTTPNNIEMVWNEALGKWEFKNKYEQEQSSGLIYIPMSESFEVDLSDEEVLRLINGYDQGVIPVLTYKEGYQYFPIPTHSKLDLEDGSVIYYNYSTGEYDFSLVCANSREFLVDKDITYEFVAVTRFFKEDFVSVNDIPLTNISPIYLNDEEIRIKLSEDLKVVGEGINYGFKCKITLSSGEVEEDRLNLSTSEFISSKKYTGYLSHIDFKRELGFADDYSKFSLDFPKPTTNLDGSIKTDSQFNLRRTAGSLSVAEQGQGDLARVTRLKGDSFVWNQLAHELTWEGTGDEIYLQEGEETKQTFPMSAGVISGIIQATALGTMRFCTGPDSVIVEFPSFLNRKYWYHLNVEENGKIKNIQIMDLSLGCGFTHEPELGEFERWLDEFYPFRNYEYCEGKVLGVKPKVLKSVAGPNLIPTYEHFGQSWYVTENSKYRTADSSLCQISVIFKSYDITSPDDMYRSGCLGFITGPAGVKIYEDRRKYLIPVMPNTRYTVSRTNPNFQVIRSEYDETYTSICLRPTVPETDQGYKNDKTFTTSPTTRYVAIQLRIQQPVINQKYEVKLSMHLADFSGDPYQPYREEEVEFNLSELKDENGQELFPDGLMRIGEFYDEIVGNTVIKRIDKRTDLKFHRYSGEHESYLSTDMFLTSLGGHVYWSENDENGYIACSKYPDGPIRINDGIHPEISRMSVFSNYSEGEGSYYNSNDLRFWDTTKSTWSNEEINEYLKDAPIYAVFETPKIYVLPSTWSLTYHPSDYGYEKILPYVEGGGTTPETMPFSGEIEYGANVLGTIESLPSNYVSVHSQKISDKDKKQVQHNIGLDWEYF